MNKPVNLWAEIGKLFDPPEQVEPLKPKPKEKKLKKQKAKKVIRSK